MEVDEVETLAVLGAGKMGHGIAEVAALAGYDVRLRDVEEEFVRDGYDQIEWSLGKLAEHGRVSESEADAALDRVEPLVDLEAAVGDADVVVEAVPERMEIKRAVYADLEERAPDRAVFATNTSSLSVTDLSEATDRAGRFCGMHFFNPPVRMDLVEVVAGEHTDPETLELVTDLAESMGKTPVRVERDSPGFVVNRVLVPLLNEAAWLVREEEATVAEVDSTARFEMGLPMGCFELADQVGLDVARDVLDHLAATLGEAYEPCPSLVEKVEAGALGEKAGEGFYDYDDGGAEVPADEGREDVRTLLVAVMANEAAALVDGGVADADAVDRAMELGAGFPEGPTAMADDAGVESLLATLEERREQTGAARYEPSGGLRAVAAEGGFRGGDDGDTGSRTYDHLRVEREGRVGHLILDREHRMNAITLEMLDEIEAAVAECEADDGVRALCLTGAGDRAFSAGADFQSVAAGGTSTVRGVDVSRRGQAAFATLEACEMPVVAGVDGYCLGGGMELATHADVRVASERSEFGQTEHDLGLMPGWGGSQRLPRLIGESRAKEVIFTAERYDAETMAEYGFLADVVENGTLRERALELAADLAAGPPVAQRFTKRAMHAGRDDLEAGLELESQAFGHLMATDDLMEGIAAFASDEDPEFEGK
jgi:enoyl-CoA hydratase/3-hydroxyacyl-CoA dehydrogenase